MQPFHPGQSNLLRSIDTLLAEASCTYIVSMDNPSQNLHIRKLAEAWEFVVPESETGDTVLSQQFKSMAELSSLVTDLHLPHQMLTDAIWCDISAYPAFPARTLYRPFQELIELQLIPDDENQTTLSPHKVFGPANLVLRNSTTLMVEPREGWLVVEYPPIQIRYQHSTTYQPDRSIPNPDGTTAPPLGPYHSSTQKHNDTPNTHIHPSRLVVYGKPSRNWSAQEVAIRHASHQA